MRDTPLWTKVAVLIEARSFLDPVTKKFKPKGAATILKQLQRAIPAPI
jgi:hypothetical protein